MLKKFLEKVPVGVIETPLVRSESSTSVYLTHATMRSCPDGHEKVPSSGGPASKVPLTRPFLVAGKVLSARTAPETAVLLLALGFFPPWLMHAYTAEA